MSGEFSQAYLCKITLAQRLSLSYLIRHANLSMHALFRSEAACKPSPLLSLGEHKVSHLIKCNFFFSLVEFQIKFLVILSSSCKTLLGSWVVCIICKGIDCSTERASVILPARAKVLAFHPNNLLWTLLIKSWYRLRDFLPWIRGEPR